MRAKYPDYEGHIDRDGVKVHYEVYGEGEETLLFMPAFQTAYGRMWKAQLPYFSHKYRCIAYDPRGNGETDRPREVADYHPDLIVGDGLAILDAMNIEQVIVIGISMGGLLGSILAAFHPERVKAAVLMNGAYPVQPDYGFITTENFNGEFDQPQGWQKYNQHYWRTDYRDFLEFFFGKALSDPHSTKAFEDNVDWGLETDGETLAKTVLARLEPSKLYDIGPEMFKRIKCPLLLIHGEEDQIQPPGKSEAVAEITGAELVLLPGMGHLPAGRFPAKINILIRDFLDRTLVPAQQTPPKANGKSARPDKRILYLSSPIGLGHARRDLAIARELRQLHPGAQVDWLAQDPVTRFLSAADETLHPASALLANESQHIEAEAGEHDLNAFQAIRNMDEILIANFMVFQEILEQQHYDLVIADEAWDVDHFWHEHPELKQTQLAWFTDFVGFMPMPDGGAHEAYLTADYNAEMIEHIDKAPSLRDRAIFVGRPDDIVPGTFGPDLPVIRGWTEDHFDFCGYITGYDPAEWGSRADLRAELGYEPGEKVCIVTVGGSGVGVPLLRRVIDAYGPAKARVPELRMILVTGPRIDPASLKVPAGVETRAFVPDLNRHLAACDLALVQGGLTTCMELTAAKTPFLYFPLRNHFEQNFHVHQRLRRYNAGRRMDYASADPDTIAAAMVEVLAQPVAFKDVETNGARLAAAMLADLL